MDLAHLPRELSWPAGLMLIFLLSALITSFFRRRSMLAGLLAKQFWIGTVVMVLVVGLIFLTLAPGEYLTYGVGEH